MNKLICSIDLFKATAIYLNLIYFLQDSNSDISTYNLTIHFTTFVMMQFWNMFNVIAFTSGKSAFRNLNKSYGFLIVLVVIFIGQVLIVKFGGDIFRTVPLKITDWLIITGATSIILWIGELKRVIWR